MLEQAECSPLGGEIMSAQPMDFSRRHRRRARQRVSSFCCAGQVQALGRALTGYRPHLAVQQQAMALPPRLKDLQPFLDRFVNEALEHGFVGEKSSSYETIASSAPPKLVPSRGVVVHCKAMVSAALALTNRPNLTAAHSKASLEAQVATLPARLGFSRYLEAMLLRSVYVLSADRCRRLETEESRNGRPGLAKKSATHRCSWRSKGTHSPHAAHLCRNVHSGRLSWS